MSQEKQIMKIIRDICPYYKEYGTCAQCNTELDIDTEPCYFEYMAKHIIRGGYRKQSDVAKEIFEKIKEMCVDIYGNFYPVIFAELEKKYTEGTE